MLRNADSGVGAWRRRRRFRQDLKAPAACLGWPVSHSLRCSNVRPSAERNR